MNFERVTFPCHVPVWKRLLDRSTSVSSVVTLPCDLRLHDAPPASYLLQPKVAYYYVTVEYVYGRPTGRPAVMLMSRSHVTLMWLGGMDSTMRVETPGITVSQLAESIFEGIRK